MRSLPTMDPFPLSLSLCVRVCLRACLARGASISPIGSHASWREPAQKGARRGRPHPRPRACQPPSHSYQRHSADVSSCNESNDAYDVYTHAARVGSSLPRVTFGCEVELGAIAHEKEGSLWGLREAG